MKTFTQWIQNELKEKWCLMYDERGARHGIETTNFAEVYNCVLRGARALPLVGIIEFFMFCTMQYFCERSEAAHTAMEYLETAQKKALLHRATSEPLQQYGNNVIQWRYGVECRAKGGLTPSGQRIHQTAELGNEICRCSCRKPQLLDRPCTHVIAACYEI